MRGKDVTDMKDDLGRFLEYYGETKKRLTAKNKAYNREIRKDKNPAVRLFMQDLADMNEGGKMLRGMLVSLGYRIGGGKNPEYSDNLSIAYEIFQTAVLVHDDIIDRAGLRRGKITIHRRYRHRMDARGAKVMSRMDDRAHIAESAALCTGDIGLYLANRKIAVDYARDAYLPELISEFNGIVLDTIRGELLDVVLPYELQDSAYSEEERKRLLEKSIRDIYHLKTARYSVIGPLHLGMMLSGAGDDALKEMDRAADDLGIAYQIMDDILGIYADTRHLGKDAGSDISEFKQTILYMYVCLYAEDAEEELLKHYGRAVTDESLEAVRRIFTETGALDYAKATMNACFERAARKIKRMKFLSDEDRSILLGFIEWCKGRRN